MLENSACYFISLNEVYPKRFFGSTINSLFIKFLIYLLPSQEGHEFSVNLLLIFCSYIDELI